MPIVRLPGGDLRDEIRQPLYSTLSIAGTGYAAALAAGAVTANPIVGLLTGSDPNSFTGQQFFTNATNTQAQWQTNMLQPGMLQTAVSYRVQGMAMDASYINNEVDSVNQSFLQQLQIYSSVRVHIGEKDYWTGPSSYLMGRIVQDGAVAAYPAVLVPPVATPASLSGFVSQHAGQPAVQGVILSGRHVVDINPLQAFFALLTVDVPDYINSIAQLADPAGVPLEAGYPSQGGANDIVNLTFSFKGLQRRPVQ